MKHIGIVGNICLIDENHIYRLIFQNIVVRGLSNFDIDIETCWQDNIGILETVRSCAAKMDCGVRIKDNKTINVYYNRYVPEVTKYDIMP